MLSWIKTAAIGLVAVASTAVACGAMADSTIQGGGATFPNPLYQRWVTEYQKKNPGVRVNYQSVGSGAGIKGLTDKTFDFAGSDAPLTKKEQDAIKADVVHIPTVAGSLVLAYNLEGVQDLKLTGPVIADIYLGKIAKWNDAKIKEINPGVNLPDAAITPAYRTDSSGSTFVFTSYLAGQSEDFKGNVGMGKAVKFPIGQGGKGSDGVAAIVQGTKGGIGYVELNYASANNIPFASVQNKDGKFIKASPDTVAAAGEAALTQMKDGKLTIDIWNQSGEKAYPISAFTYVIIYKDLTYMKDAAKAKALVEFLRWATTEGQGMAAAMDYAPLSDGVQKEVAKAIASVTVDGRAVASAK